MAQGRRGSALAIAPGALLAGMAGGIAFPILPILCLQVGVALPLIGLILAANRITRLLTAPLVGALADRIGGRRTLIGGMAVQSGAISLYLLGVVTGHPALFFLLGRLLDGVGGASVFVAAQSLALHAGGREHGGSATATVRAALMVGAPLGLVTGGILADTVGDVATFCTAIVALGAAALAGIALVPDLRGPAAARRGVRAALRGFGERRLMAIGVLNFAVSFSAQGVVLATLALVVHARGVSLAGLGDEGTAGIIMGCLAVVCALSMPVTGRLGDRFGARGRAHMAAAGLAVLVPGLVIVALAHHAAGLMLGLGVLGLGAGAMGPSLLALLNDLVPADRRGVSVGLMQLCGDVGAALGPLVGTALFAGGVERPYLASAAFLACFLPVALSLARRSPGLVTGGPDPFAAPEPRPAGPR